MRRFDLIHPFFADPVVPVAPVIKPVVVPVAAKKAEPKADMFSSIFGAKKVVPAKPVVEKTGKYQILTYSRRRAPAPFFRVHLVADALFLYAHIHAAPVIKPPAPVVEPVVAKKAEAKTDFFSSFFGSSTAEPAEKKGLSFNSLPRYIVDPCFLC